MKQRVLAASDAAAAAHAEDSAPAVVSLQGQLAAGGLLQNNGTSPSFAVVFACPRPGSFAVEIDIDLFPAGAETIPNQGSRAPISFRKTWQKFNHLLDSNL